AAAADRRFEIASGEPLLLHHELDGGDGIGRGYGNVLGLIGLYERHQHLDAVAGRRSRLGVPEPLHFLQRRPVIRFGSDGASFHLYRSLHGRGVDSVVFLVRTDEAYVDTLSSITNGHHEPILVASDIKDRASVS